MAFSSRGTKYRLPELLVFGLGVVCFLFPFLGYLGGFVFFFHPFFLRHNAVKTVQISVLLVIGLKLIFMYPNASTKEIDCPGDCSS